MCLLLLFFMDMDMDMVDGEEVVERASWRVVSKYGRRVEFGGWYPVSTSIANFTFWKNKSTPSPQIADWMPCSNWSLKGKEDE